MKQIFVFIICFLLYLGNSYSQEDNPGRFNVEKIREYRSKVTIPPYDLSKVKKLIAQTANKPGEEDHESIQALEVNLYKALSLQEKFTYVMIHPELYAQNCSIFMPQPDEDKKVYSHLISWTDEGDWSKRQLDFLRDNRDSVMALIRESTSRSGHMGVNYKDAIVEINGWQMIPFIVSYYEKTPKDKDALTLLLLLMRKGEYEPFLKSSSYKQLYGSDYNYESYINFNAANEALIIKRAKTYYDEKK